jgi:hypothetical protein
MAARREQLRTRQAANAPVLERLTERCGIVFERAVRRQLPVELVKVSSSGAPSEGPIHQYSLLGARRQPGE